MPKLEEYAKENPPKGGRSCKVCDTVGMDGVTAEGINRAPSVLFDKEKNLPLYAEIGRWLTQSRRNMGNAEIVSNHNARDHYVAGHNA